MKVVATRLYEFFEGGGDVRDIVYGEERMRDRSADGRFERKSRFLIHKIFARTCAAAYNTGAHWSV